MPTLCEAKIDDYFSCLDQTGDGRLDKRDLDAVIERLWTGEPPPAVSLIAAYGELWERIATMDQNGDHKVDRAEFGKFFTDAADAVRAGESVPEAAMAHVRAAFEALDTDGDGHITVEEYGSWLHAIGSDALPKLPFGWLDLDDDGHLDLRDLERLFVDWLTSEDRMAVGNVLMTGRLAPSIQ
jgi:Ca2+-binding EF-hand superfamily protein